MAIMRAILHGERDGRQLARLADPRIKKSKQEIAEAQVGHWDEELMYELNDCFEIYEMLQLKIKGCELKMEALLASFTEDVYPDPQVRLTKKQTKGKNQPKFDLPKYSYKFYGVDLYAIESVSASTVMSLLSEIGYGIYKFPTAKPFASYLRLAPNNKISGGKVIAGRTPKGTNKFALALRNAANTMDRTKDGALTRFFKRIAYKKGRGVAITATARKLAVIIWNMVVKKEPYKPLDTTSYHQMVKAQKLASIKKQMAKAGITVEQLYAT